MSSYCSLGQLWRILAIRIRIDPRDDSFRPQDVLIELELLGVKLVVVVIMTCR